MEKGRKILISWGFIKKSDFQGGEIHEKPIYRGELPQKGKGDWRVCKSKGEIGEKEGGGVFEGSGLIPQYIL